MYFKIKSQNLADEGTLKYSINRVHLMRTVILLDTSGAGNRMNYFNSILKMALYRMILQQIADICSGDCEVAY